MKRSTKVFLIILLVLFLDQSLKIWVKTHMNYGEEIRLFGFDWALIHFVENNGMAFGISLGGDFGKLFLSLFRIFAVLFLVYYLRELLRTKAPFGLLASFGLILAGALGNIFDSAFYGLIFSESHYHSVAEIFPPGGGYAGFLHGKVVDMLYFPMAQGRFPDYIPFVGGDYYLFFKPVFNIADLSITLGVLYILLFQRTFFTHASTRNEDEEKEALDAETALSDPTATEINPAESPV